LEEEAAPREWECFIVRDAEMEKTEDGKDMVVSVSDPKPVPVSVRLTLKTIVYPLNLFRQDGRWCMSFNFLGQGGLSPALAVKCGEGGALSLEEAVGLFCGGVPDSARPDVFAQRHAGRAV
jgi:hypothetical protein